MRTSVITPILGIKVSFKLFTFISSNLFHYFNNIHGNRAGYKASAAADTSELAVIVFREINQLVHESLAEAFFLGQTGVAMRHFGEVGVHTGVPAAESLHAMTGIVVLDVVALAGRAYERAGSARDARFGQVCPSRCVEQLVELVTAEAFRRQVGKR